MGREIERKFLVTEESWQKKATSVHIRQGFFHTWRGHTVRVRIYDDKAFVTFKSRASGSIRRSEFEYAIPLEDAREMLATLCDQPLIEKRRHTLMEGGREWTVDVFTGVNKGLVLAEVELESEQQQLELPNWAGEDVSKKPCFYNAYLTQHPYITWCMDLACDGNCGLVHPPGIHFDDRRQSDR
ncbi:MAG: CYTH domain-containing protein [Magnetococcales bacterium]|nr:CYTH domain-containing protein [Magnetococcales bacterium]